MKTSFGGNYDECILLHMPDAHTNSAVELLEDTCEGLFPEGPAWRKEAE